ncbi:hypothetical protein [Hydrogenimonas sp. SS33]|uniref:hypothetical protein n=1 Tax=Hydrogenimonas leucolamina TaxID=2954236 RepID=UPI00336C06D5
MNEALRQLRDIKPPVAVPDHSAWVFSALLLVLLLLLAALYWWWRSRRKPVRRRRRKSPEEVARERLRAIDYDDTKGAVYTFGEYLPLLIASDREAMETFEALEKELAPYKYKKEVPPLPKALRKRMERLVKRGLKR